MSDNPKVKAILGYDISEGIDTSDYENWLAEVHFPDLLSNPFLDRIVANDIIRPVTVSSVGSPTMEKPATFYRIVELHFADREAYDRYLQWFAEHPIDPERGPAGRTTFRFYVLADSAIADHDHPYQPAV